MISQILKLNFLTLYILVFYYSYKACYLISPTKVIPCSRKVGKKKNQLLFITHERKRVNAEIFFYWSFSLRFVRFMLVIPRPVT
jgi:hypothetical protein